MGTFTGGATLANYSPCDFRMAKPKLRPDDHVASEEYE